MHANTHAHTYASRSHHLTRVRLQVREALLYNSPDLLQRLPEGILPAVIYARHSFWAGENVVLMEDMVLRGVSPVNYVFGNQIW